MMPSPDAPRSAAMATFIDIGPGAAAGQARRGLGRRHEGRRTEGQAKGSGKQAGTEHRTGTFSRPGTDPAPCRHGSKLTLTLIKIHPFGCRGESP